MARNVFLSFAMADQPLVDLFRGQAKNRRLPIDFRDHSVKEPFDSAWKTHAEEKIRRCSVTMCLVGSNTFQSDAVAWEVHKSVELGKGLMAVYLTDEYPPTPKALRDHSVTPVRWEMDSIVKELTRIGP